MCTYFDVIHQVLSQFAGKALNSCFLLTQKAAIDEKQVLIMSELIHNVQITDYLQITRDFYSPTTTLT